MSNNGHPGYDEKLLAAAPAVDKGMLQSGYTTDLLEKSSSSTPPPSHRDLEAGTKPARTQQRNYSNPPPASKPPPPQEKTPFFRTTKGIIILVVAFVVIIAAVVGGAVGGTRKKNNNVDTQSAGSGNSTDSIHTVSQSTVGPAGSTTSSPPLTTGDIANGTSTFQGVSPIPTPSPLPTGFPTGPITSFPGNPPVTVQPIPTQTTPDGGQGTGGQSGETQGNGPIGVDG
ncbi:hypothetical protein CVT24_005169 [Panaeolus cyanescens]|uniref:Uncharacterized protein n=1 Tax=Panaeolus cyanescens TaxID=181874 RepID=A0A409Y960_9AGAR|nr:hypothetical protein CVT24_005169 [Panaeolus cyanescens]